MHTALAQNVATLPQACVLIQTPAVHHYLVQVPADGLLRLLPESLPHSNTATPRRRPYLPRSTRAFPGRRASTQQLSCCAGTLHLLALGNQSNKYPFFPPPHKIGFFIYHPITILRPSSFSPSYFGLSFIACGVRILACLTYPSSTMATARDTASSGSSGNQEKVEDVQHYATKTDTNNNLDKLDTYATANLNAVFENPLAGLSREALMEDVEEFCRKFDLMDHIHVFKKGALVSQNPSEIRNISDLTPEDVETLELEKAKKWHQPWRLYWLVGMSEQQFLRQHFSLQSCSDVFACCCSAGYG